MFLCPWGFSRQEDWSGLSCASPEDLSNPGIKPRSPALQADSLLSEPPGKPKNTGVGSLSLLQGNFPTQELNWGLLHCRLILYQLSYEGRPELKTFNLKKFFFFTYLFIWLHRISDVVCRLSSGGLWAQ